MASPQNPRQNLPRITRFNRSLADAARGGANAFRVFLVIASILIGILILIAFVNAIDSMRYGIQGEALFFMFLFTGLVIFALVALFRFNGAVYNTVDLIEQAHNDLERELDQMRDVMRGKTPSPAEADEQPGFFEDEGSDSPSQKPPAKDDDFLL